MVDKYKPSGTFVFVSLCLKYMVKGDYLVRDENERWERSCHKEGEQIPHHQILTYIIIQLPIFKTGKNSKTLYTPSLSSPFNLMAFSS